MCYLVQMMMAHQELSLFHIQMMAHKERTRLAEMARSVQGITVEHTDRLLLQPTDGIQFIMKQFRCSEEEAYTIRQIAIARHTGVPQEIMLPQETRTDKKRKRNEARKQRKRGDFKEEKKPDTDSKRQETVVISTHADDEDVRATLIPSHLMANWDDFKQVLWNRGMRWSFSTTPFGRRCGRTDGMEKIMFCAILTMNDEQLKDAGIIDAELIRVARKETRLIRLVDANRSHIR